MISRETRIGLWGALAFILLFLLIGLVTVYGQSPPPTVTEVEQLKLENIQLKAAQIQQQMKDLQAQFTDLQKQYKDLSDQIEKEHPGMVWNGTALVAKPVTVERKEAPPKTTNK